MRPKDADGPKVGYVLKVFPRLSQSFVLHELLAHQRAGRAIEIFSLRRPKDRLTHRALGELRLPVVYPTRDTPSSTDEVARWCRTRKLEHLHAHFGNVAAATARQVAGECGISYSFTAHARDIFHRSVIEDRLRERLADAAFSVTVSEFNLRYLRQHYGAAASRVERIYNGLPLERFRFAPFDVVAADEGPRLLLAVGRWIPKKGFGVLIEACARMRAAGTSFRCEIVGSGELEADYRRQIDERNLRNVVKLLGPLPDRTVRRKMREASVFAAPCIVAPDGDRDGLPTVLLEAMALGTPCVSTPVTGIPEAIVDRETGRLVPEGDAHSLAAVCSELLSDRSQRQWLAVQARSHIESRFDIDVNVHRLAGRFRDATLSVRSR